MNKHRLLKLAQLLQSAGYHKKAAEIKKIATYRNVGGPNDIDLESFFGEQGEQDTLENTMVNDLINEIKENLNKLRTPLAKRIFLQGVEIPKYLSRDDKNTFKNLIKSLLDDLDKETRWNRAKDHK
jgi:hypothetical protein